MYIATYTINIIALLFLFGLIYLSASVEGQRKKPFQTVIVITIIIIMAEAGTILAQAENMNIPSLHMLSNVFGFSLAPLIPIIITLIFAEKKISNYMLILLPTIINLGLTIVSPFFGFIFYINEENQYERGSFFFVFIIVYCLNSLYLVFRTVKTGKEYNYPIMKKMLILSFFTIAGTSIQLIYPQVYSSWHCVTFSLFLYFLIMSEFDCSFDVLTGLYNRATFEKVAKTKIKTKGFSLIIMDIDNFKSINDTHGHNYGDKVLKLVSKSIRSIFNKNYVCFRYGGDEFAIISTEVDKKEIENRLEELKRALKKTDLETYNLPTLSCGYSIFLEDEKVDFYQVIQEADNQMYKCKKIHKVNQEESK